MVLQVRTPGLARWDCENFLRICSSRRCSLHSYRHGMTEDSSGQSGSQRTWLRDWRLAVKSQVWLRLPLSPAFHKLQSSTLKMTPEPADQAKGRQPAGGSLSPQQDNSSRRTPAHTVKDPPLQEHELAPRALLSKGCVIHSTMLWAENQDRGVRSCLHYFGFSQGFQKQVL